MGWSSIANRRGFACWIGEPKGKASGMRVEPKPAGLRRCAARRVHLPRRRFDWYVIFLRPKVRGGLGGIDGAWPPLSAHPAPLLGLRPGSVDEEQGWSLGGDLGGGRLRVR